MALAQIDLSNVIARDAAFASDRAHEIANFYSITGADRHEEACHSWCGSASAAPSTIARSGASNRRRVLRCLSTLRALALEEMQSGSGNFGCVELL
jgi:hypothetical protein